MVLMVELIVFQIGDLEQSLLDLKDPKAKDVANVIEGFHKEVCMYVECQSLACRSLGM